MHYCWHQHGIRDSSGVHCRRRKWDSYSTGHTYPDRVEWCNINCAAGCGVVGFPKRVTVAPKPWILGKYVLLRRQRWNAGWFLKLWASQSQRGCTMCSRWVGIKDFHTCVFFESPYDIYICQPCLQKTKFMVIVNHLETRGWSWSKQLKNACKNKTSFAHEHNPFCNMSFKINISVKITFKDIERKFLPSWTTLYRRSAKCTVKVACTKTWFQK